MLIQPDTTIEYRATLNDKEVIQILQRNLEYYNVVPRVFQQFLPKEKVKLDEEGFHELLTLWVELNVFTDEYVMQQFYHDIEKIKFLLYGERQQESN